MALVAGAVLASAATFAWMSFAPRHVPPGQPPLATIGADSLPAFRDVFNAGEGEVRILVLLSPT